jgi:hypothetical protein
VSSACVRAHLQEGGEPLRVEARLAEVERVVNVRWRRAPRTWWKSAASVCPSERAGGGAHAEADRARAKTDRAETDHTEIKPWAAHVCAKGAGRRVVSEKQKQK